MWKFDLKLFKSPFFVITIMLWFCLADLLTTVYWALKTCHWISSYTTPNIYVSVNFEPMQHWLYRDGERWAVRNKSYNRSMNFKFQNPANYNNNQFSNVNFWVPLIRFGSFRRSPPARYIGFARGIFIGWYRWTLANFA